MNRREFCHMTGGAGVGCIIADDFIEPAKAEPAPPLKTPWKVVNIEEGQKRPQEVEKALNSLTEAGFSIVGAELCTQCNDVQIYAKRFCVADC